MYFNPGGGDCANFVTQCLVAGGRDPYDPYLQQVWTSNYFSATLPHTKDYLIPFLEKIAIGQIGDTTDIQVGDLVFLKDGDSYPHTVIIVEISDSIYYAGHNTNHRRKGLLYPLSQKWHYYRILDGYVFYPNWNSQGVGYYYYNIYNWIGPHLYEDFSAAGINPQNGQEYRGFNQFTVSGTPSNANITHAYLRLTVNSCFGAAGDLGLNINHITYTGIPTPYHCAAPPYYIQEQEITASSGATLWFDLTNTNAPTHIMEANNGNNMFGIGLSENNAKVLRLYFFEGFYSNINERPKIKVFFDDISKNEYSNYNTITNKNSTELSIIIQNSLIKNGTKIQFSSNNEEEAILRIYDIGGRLIRTWISNGGENTIYWDCRDNLGNLCTKGTYFVRLITSSNTITEKLEILQ